MGQLVWSTVVALHGAAAVAWWWLMPRGFPPEAPEFWVNQMAPFAVLVAVAALLFARGAFAEAVVPPLYAAIPAAWISFALSSRLAFPDSVGSAWNLPFIGGFGLVVLWVKRFAERKPSVVGVLVCVAVAGYAGWTFPRTQRAPDPSTHPAGVSVPDAPANLATETKLVRLSRDAQIYPPEARVVFRRDKIVMSVQPLLTFANRSTDRTWTSLAPADLNVPTRRAFVGKTHEGATVRLFYKDEDVSVLDLAAHGDAIQIDARSRLARPTYSHLNQLAEITINGHRKLAIGFSPLGKKIEVTSARAAARFAYVDANHTFHVMEASDREKGPFSELGSGRLAPGDPLVISLFDGDGRLFQLTLDDWAAQASTERSPSAGWGIPMNAIQWARSDEAESSPALLMLSLASTSIGRGVQSVGHAPGVYRNRIKVTR